MFKKLLLPFFIFSSTLSFATHVIGGTLTYQHLGGNTYRVTLQLYRDCNGSTPFPATMIIQVKNSVGNSISSITAPLSVTGPNNTNYPCITNPNVCMDVGFYTVNTNLPPLTGGYHLYAQYCCRSASILNIVNPLSTGDSWNTYIPDANIWLFNSSPQWTNQPTVYICQNQPASLIFSAADADGDSLVHTWYTPYTDQAPTFPNWIQFTPINWANGYGAGNPCGGPPWILNPTTGIATGTPPNQGVYIIGVKVEEYRNGIKIGEIVRDYNVAVINCGPLPVASFLTNDTICLGQNSSFVNNSSGDSTYAWNFGDLSSTSDTSSVMNPNYLYTATGSYIVNLIINPGQAYCTDTATDTIVVQLCTGLEESEMPEFYLFPIPASENIELKFQGFPSGEIQFNINDALGRIAYAQVIPSVGNNFIKTLSITTLPRGVYFVKVQQNEYVTVKKLIVN